MIKKIHWGATIYTMQKEMVEQDLKKDLIKLTFECKQFKLLIFHQQSE